MSDEWLTTTVPQKTPKRPTRMHPFSPLWVRGLLVLQGGSPNQHPVSDFHDGFKVFILTLDDSLFSMFLSLLFFVWLLICPLDALRGLSTLTYQRHPFLGPHPF
ncbi:hypothetical protein L873DRAFT_515616 [Choiromyces venosus 120613-1]|uniref:Uncharacterized protein n=1 Tax=Choiromyces venosus 120613-1 TaxID=1336337 RepID=A0A3N4IUT4_9PEZI|nr:hypothetical protein L873DRAFT_515616 [Choiromyces venosus 120613-1]